MHRQSTWCRSWNQFLNAFRADSPRKRSAAKVSSHKRRFEALEERAVLSANFGSALTIGNGVDTSVVFDVATDSAGYRYVSGWFAGAVDFDVSNLHEGDADILTARGPGDAYVAKYAPDDSLVWVQPMGGDGPSADMASRLAVDSAGAVYVVGTFHNSADFGGTTLTSAGDWDRFVTKLDAGGNFLFAQPWDDDEGATRGMDVDAAGNMYVLIGRLGDAYEITKFGASGHEVWSKTIVNRSMLGSADLAVSAAGTVYIAGSFDGTVDFDPSAKTKYVSSGTARAGFVLKLDANGKFGWVSPFIGKKVGSINGASGATSITLDGSGNILVGGTFNGTVDFNPGGGTTYMTTQSGGFVTKLNSAGALVWVKPLLGNAPTFVYGLDVDAAGNVYATGTYHGTVDLDPGAGAYSRTTVGQGDVYVMKLTSAGNLVWAETFGGSGNDVSFGIAVDSSGTVNLAGHYREPFDVDPDPLAIELLPGGSVQRGFLLRLEQS